jgi:Domain of unknown function (DUF4384)/LPP20 lipoprotein
MSSHSVKVGILLLLSTLTSCTASPTSERAALSHQSGPQESGHHDVLFDIGKQYPSELYLIGIGKGTSERAAIELARADLLKNVRTEIKVTWTDLLLEKNGRGEQEVSRLVETRAMELVQGLETVAQWRDASTGEAYCAVALAKGKVAKILQDPHGQSDVAGEPREASPVAPEDVWVTAEGTVVFREDMTIAEARARSRDEARRKASEQAVGVFVRASTVVYNFGLAEDLVHSIVRGVVIEEHILSEGLREIDIGKGEKALAHDTTLKALIRPVRAERTTFFIEGHLNKPIFFANEEMVITVAASEAAYIHIFNVEQDNAVTVLFPNKFTRNNLLNGKKVLIFPDDELRQMGVRLRVVPPAGATKALEKIKLIATKKNLDLPQGRFDDASFQTYQGRDTGLVTDLMKELTKLQDSEWAEMTVSYEVLNK